MPKEVRPGSVDGELHDGAAADVALRPVAVDGAIGVDCTQYGADAVLCACAVCASCRSQRGATRLVVLSLVVA